MLENALAWPGVEVTSDSPLSDPLTEIEDHLGTHCSFRNTNINSSRCRGMYRYVGGGGLQAFISAFERMLMEPAPRLAAHIYIHSWSTMKGTGHTSDHSSSGGQPYKPNPSKPQTSGRDGCNIWGEGQPGLRPTLCGGWGNGQPALSASLGSCSTTTRGLWEGCRHPGLRPPTRHQEHGVRDVVPQAGQEQEQDQVLQYVFKGHLERIEQMMQKSFADRLEGEVGIRRNIFKKDQE